MIKNNGVMEEREVRDKEMIKNSNSNPFIVYERCHVLEPSQLVKDTSFQNKKNVSYMSTYSFLYVDIYLVEF